MVTEASTTGLTLLTVTDCGEGRRCRHDPRRGKSRVAPNQLAVKGLRRVASSSMPRRQGGISSDLARPCVHRRTEAGHELRASEHGDTSPKRKRGGSRSLAYA